MSNTIIRPCLFAGESDLPRNTPIYKYLSIESFLYLLVSKSLLFSKITSWPDAYEGVRFRFMKRVKNVYPKKNIEQFYGSCWSLQIEDSCLYHDNHEFNQAIEELAKHGSVSMWESYCKKGGVRLKTTIEKLDTLIKKSFSHTKVLRGKVHYETQASWRKAIQSRDWINSLLIKRVAFRHESEYRYILIKKEKTKNKFISLPTGDLYDFFDEILISPSTEENKWISETLFKLSVSLTIDIKKGRTNINNKDGKAFSRISQLYSFVPGLIG